MSDAALPNQPQLDLDEPLHPSVAALTLRSLHAP